jgi:hypothetical protein
MRRRRPRIERLRFRVFDERAREALREMAGGHGSARGRSPALGADAAAALEGRVAAAIEEAEPLASPLSSFVIERTAAGLALRQIQAAPPAADDSRSGADDRPSAARADRPRPPREITLAELELPLS